jgi:hypothetical protein
MIWTRWRGDLEEEYLDLQSVFKKHARESKRRRRQRRCASGSGAASFFGTTGDSLGIGTESTGGCLGRAPAWRCPAGDGPRRASSRPGSRAGLAGRRPECEAVSSGVWGCRMWTAKDKVWGFFFYLLFQLWPAARVLFCFGGGDDFGP